MGFPENLKAKYALGMNDRDFSNNLNQLESEIFLQMPWLLELPEEMQNEVVWYIYAIRYGRLH